MVFALGKNWFLAKCAYRQTKEKARGGIEKREYWQTDDINWLDERKDWIGLKSLAMILF
ncbi:MAG: hypothetical protein FWC89_07445 [Defluviitaleaceae bacterium]|nr:hypothetical protein [Defluviitaleaceae bacterium]